MGCEAGDKVRRSGTVKCMRKRSKGGEGAAYEGFTQSAEAQETVT